MVKNQTAVFIAVASLVAGAFISSPELRAYAANTVGSIDIINESILSEDIKNGQVKGADLGANAVTNNKIADNTITSTKIADGTVTSADIGFQTIGLLDMSPGSVSSTTILDSTIDELTSKPIL